MRMIKKMRHFRRDCNGAATVEFAVVAVTVIVLTPLLYDLSTVVGSFLSLDGSMRAGVQYTLKYPTDTAGITNTIQGAGGFSTINVTNTESCQCSGNTVTCGGTCSGGVAQAVYRTIAATYDVPTLLPYEGYPTNHFTISQSTMVRVQ
jgi:Flp pilus assembly protein TadG